VDPGRNRRLTLARVVRRRSREIFFPRGAARARKASPVSRSIAAALSAAILLAGAVLAGVANGAGAPTPPKATNGGTVTLVASGLHTPTSFAMGDGTLFEGDAGSDSNNAPPNGGVFAVQHGRGVRLAGSPQYVAGLAWHAGTLYVSGGSQVGPKTAAWTIQAWTGWDGTGFASRRVLYTAPKSFGGFNGLAYGSDGRLYVGADVGLLDGNDHGPASTSPDLYDILALSPHGGAPHVYARGMRQPWQLVFTPGSTAPLVSDLAQDKGTAKNAPDLLLRVHPGDNYGFPGCTWLASSPCSGFTRPFVRFAAHTDIMGLAVIGNTLYMTSFGGPHGKGPGGQVLAMPLTGGKTWVIVSGFVAPVVGLAASRGRLYIGELTGQAFSVKP
jgi:glucose/arabinose dehydrogenase